MVFMNDEMTVRTRPSKHGFYAYIECGALAITSLPVYRATEGEARRDGEELARRAAELDDDGWIKEAFG